jgi:hypothetical protein
MQCLLPNESNDYGASSHRSRKVPQNGGGDFQYGAEACNVHNHWPTYLQMTSRVVKTLHPSTASNVQAQAGQ